MTAGIILVVGFFALGACMIAIAGIIFSHWGKYGTSPLFHCLVSRKIVGLSLSSLVCAILMIVNLNAGIEWVLTTFGG